MPNAFQILKQIQRSSKRIWVFPNTGANAFAKNQMRLAYEDKHDLYCMLTNVDSKNVIKNITEHKFFFPTNFVWGVGDFGVPHAPTRGSRGVRKGYTSSYDHDTWPAKILEQSTLAVKSYHPETLAAEE